MAPSTTASISEHWLTLMTCIVCERTPDESPVYQCNLGHIVCLNCFKEMTKHGIPQCSHCTSTKFRARVVSADFLKKLKIKPGIGRPYRYCVKSRNSTPSETSCVGVQKEELTVEKVFNMPIEKVQEIFEKKDKETLSKAKDSNTYVHCRCSKMQRHRTPWNLVKQDSSEWFVKRMQNPVSRESSFLVSSRKPINCPHNPCNKIIAMSAFYTHFKHEHSDLPKFHTERGKEVDVTLDPRILEFNKTFCLGMASVYELKRQSMMNDNPSNASNVSKKSNQIPVDTFWVMASGSSELNKSLAYVIFWIFSNNDECYNCTLELSAHGDATSISTFCSVNSKRDSHEISEIAERLNCLYVTYGGMENILAYGPKPRFRFAIH